MKLLISKKNVKLSQHVLAEILGDLHRGRGYIETKENLISKGITDLFNDDFVVKVLREIGNRNTANRK